MPILWDDEQPSRKASSTSPSSTIIWDDEEQVSRQPTRQSFFDRPEARILFPGVGGILGRAAGTAGGAAAGGIGAIPGGFVGATTGAGAGESVRQFLASLTGGGPRSFPEAAQETVAQAALEPIGMGIGEGVETVGKIAGKGLSTTGRYLYRNIKPEPLLEYAKQRFQSGINLLDKTRFQSREALFNGLKTLRTAVESVRQTPPQAPSPKVLYPVAEKATNAFEAIRESTSQAFGKVAQQAQEAPIRVSLIKTGKYITQEVRNKELIDLKGQPIRLGGHGFTKDESVLMGLWDDFTNFVPKVSPRVIEGGTTVAAPGTFANYQTARRLIDRLDEALGTVTTRNTKRIIVNMKQQLSEGLKSADAALAKQSPQYGDFVKLRDIFESATSDPDKTVALLLRALKDTKQGLRQSLERLNELAPQSTKFLDDFLAYEDAAQTAELAKRAPQSLSQLFRGVKTNQDLERIATKIFDLPETTIAELEALEKSTGVPFLTELRDIAASRAFRGSTPKSLLGLGSAAVLGSLGSAFGLPGIGAGAMAGLTMGTPQVQGVVLKRLFPILGKASAVSRTIQPAAVPAITTLLRSGRAIMQDQE